MKTFLKDNFSINIAIFGEREDPILEFAEIFDQRILEILNIRLIGLALKKITPRISKFAKDRGIFLTTDYHELYGLDGLDIIINISDSEEILKYFVLTKPSNVSIIDKKSAYLLFLPYQIEEDRIQRFIDALPYRIMVVNRDLTIHRVNKAFVRELNLFGKDMIGEKCYKVRYGLDKPCYKEGRRCYVKEFINGKQAGNFQDVIYKYKTDSGEERYDSITVTPIYNEKGKLCQIIEISIDVTDRVKLEKELIRSKTFFENVIKNSVDGIVFLDRKGNVLIFNEAMEKLTGYSADEIINKGHLSYFYDINLARENMRKMRSNEYGPPGKLNPISMTIKHKSGEEIPVTLTASIIKIDGEEIGSVGIFRDMREINKMREDLESTRLQLIQSEKIASIGRMAAGVAHEINNPLSGILIYAELLKDELKDRPELQKDIQEIINQTLRCKRIVSELLQFSRQSIGKPSYFDLEELLNFCLNILQKQALFHDIKVIKKIEPNMPKMYGDIGQLQQVFINLFINAADAMEGKGTLTIETYFDSENNRFIIKVSDTGPGIPEELRDKIFEPFFTTKPTGKGTGLGLSISQNIVNLHGGNIRFECPPEGGTTFIIELPAKAEEKSVEQPLFIGEEV